MLLLLQVLLFILVLVVFSIPIKPLPPIGWFFSPFDGFWAQAREETQDFTLEHPYLRQPVKIIFDERLVPHIYAQNLSDLYFAQGYVTAYFRLWQMETQIRAAEGSLSEVLGEKALDYDRYRRHLGIRYAAENTLKMLMKDSLSAQIVRSYCEGVNAYIRQLRYRTFPLEYKLLNYQPRLWEPIHTALLLKMMAWDLTGKITEDVLTHYRIQYGKEVVDKLFPNYPYITVPIVPEEQPLDFFPIEIPEPPSSQLWDSLKQFVLWVQKDTLKEDNHGSNNWAVSGKKTQSGYPILCNDPHLNLRLPAIWIEMALYWKEKGCYGVAIPGAPGIVLGFNRYFAWGSTNVGSDFLDLYLVKLKKDQYFYEGKWLPLRKRIETIKVRNGKTIQDTVYYTHHGPLIQKHEHWGVALRWLAHEPSNELLTFFHFNWGANYQDFLKGLQYFYCPPQNFVYADTQHIALWSQGKFPLKWEGQGKFLCDGRYQIYDWQGWIPQSHNPHVVDPPQGFVFSANQPPASPKNYPYYLDWDFAPFERAQRIYQRLNTMENITVDSMKQLQLDTYHPLAAMVLPHLLKKLPDTFQGIYKQALNILQRWDYYMDAKSKGATLFKVFWQQLERALWHDEFPYLYPRRDITAWLILHADTIPWADNRNTPEKGTLPILVEQSFKNAVDLLQQTLGDTTHWQWYRFKKSHIPHLAPMLKGFGTPLLEVGGDKQVVNALGTSHGPSWRMIVSLKPPVQGWGVYPGGQTGNPLNPEFQAFVTTWAKGEYYPLKLYPNPKKIKKRMQWHFTPALNIKE